MWVNPSYLPWYLSDTCDRPPWDILTFTDDLVSRKMQKITVLTLTYKIKESMVAKIKLLRAVLSGECERVLSASLFNSA